MVHLVVDIWWRTLVNLPINTLPELHDILLTMSTTSLSTSIIVYSNTTLQAYVHVQSVTIDWRYLESVYSNR